MWLCATLAAAAEPAPVPLADALPLQVQDEERWAAVDRRAVRTARVGLAAGVVGLAATTSGLALLGAADFGDDAAQGPGVALVVAGSLTSAVATPTYLGAVGRSHRALRERNVFTGAGSSAGAWTLFGVGLPFASLGAASGAPFVVPVWQGLVLGLGCAQAAHDDRVRRGAGLPTTGVPWRVQLAPRPDGIGVHGTF